MIVDYSLLETDRATVFINGNLVTYKYPLGLLKGTKNLVYDNGKTEIFR